MVFRKLVVAMSRPFSPCPLFCCRKALRGTTNSPPENPRRASATAVWG